MYRIAANAAALAAAAARTSIEICHLIVVPRGHPAKPVKRYTFPN
jgi:hypothetical protein